MKYTVQDWCNDKPFQINSMLPDFTNINEIQTVIFKLYIIFKHLTSEYLRKSSTVIQVQTLFTLKFELTSRWLAKSKDIASCYTLIKGYLCCLLCVTVTRAHRHVSPGDCHKAPVHMYTCREDTYGVRVKTNKLMQPDSSKVWKMLNLFLFPLTSFVHVDICCTHKTPNSDFKYYPIILSVYALSSLCTCLHLLYLVNYVKYQSDLYS